MEFGAKAIYEGSTAMERRGKKQDGAEGEAEMHCRLDKISVIMKAVCLAYRSNSPIMWIEK